MRHMLRLAAAAGLWLTAAAYGGEIIVSPAAESATESAANASSQKNRARAFRKDRLHPGGDPKNTTILILPGDSDEGMLSPGRNSADSAASENRQRAIDSRKPDIPHDSLLLTPSVPGPDAGSTSTTAERAHENRVKARAYSRQKGDRPLGVGPDGIPYIDCGDAGSVSGRIGDDTRAGNIVTIIRDNRVIKARCL